MIDKATVRQIVIDGIRDLGDVRDVSVAYAQATAGTYDTDSGTVSTITTTTTCPALFTDYDMREIRLSEGRIQKEDRRVLIIPSELSLTPQFGDTLTRANGELWAIPQDGSITKDPSDALWLIQVRKVTNG